MISMSRKIGQNVQTKIKPWLNLLGLGYMSRKQDSFDLRLSDSRLKDRGFRVSGGFIGLMAAVCLKPGKFWDALRD